MRQGEPIGGGMRLRGVKGLLLIPLVLLPTVGCTSSRDDTSPANHAGSARPTSTQTVSATATCQAHVPGAQHAAPTTVDHVRHSAMGLIIPIAAKNFAPGESGSSQALYCYRWIASRGVDEWWAVSSSGSTVRIGGLGGVTHDLGIFDGRWSD